jgi:ankyrin repeat protein
MTGLHWAVVGGQLDTIQLLLERGAPLDAKNVYGGTALGQALWSAINGGPGIDYVPIIETLIDAGAEIAPGSLGWLEREGRSSPAKVQIAEVLRRHGARS